MLSTALTHERFLIRILERSKCLSATLTHERFLMKILEGSKIFGCMAAIDPIISPSINGGLKMWVEILVVEIFF